VKCTCKSALDGENRIWDVPWFTPDPEKDKDLDGGIDQDLTDDTGQDFLGDQTCSGSFRVDFRVWQCSAHWLVSDA
jgi:hypothetical protein